MSEITLEKNHALLEKLAEYVMTEIPAMKEKLDQKADKDDIARLYRILETKADKADVERLERKVNRMIEGMDAQTKRLESLTFDNISTSRTLNIHEDRLGDLEEHVFGARLREDEEQYKNKDAAEK